MRAYVLRELEQVAYVCPSTFLVLVLLGPRCSRRRSCCWPAAQENPESSKLRLTLLPQDPTNRLWEVGASSLGLTEAYGLSQIAHWSGCGAIAPLRACLT